MSLSLEPKLGIPSAFLVKADLALNPPLNGTLHSLEVTMAPKKFFELGTSVGLSKTKIK